MCTTSPLFIHLSIGIFLGCFPILDLENSAAVNIEVHPSFQSRVLSGSMPQRMIAGSYDNSVFNFKQSPYYFP